ncbi:MAG: signal peptide peptidase SppA [Xenococcaceae cyanobacterium MO_188.B29]|nr:signal peptide peptidase SppA [Xenococcaceae cyanobacterium MO_188.B29]
MGQFIKQTFASLIGSLTGLFLFCAIGTSSLVFLFFSTTSQQQEPTVQEKSILTFDLSTEIADSQPPANIAQAISGGNTNTMTLRQVLNALDKAAEDEHIVGIFLDGRKGVGSSGYANLAEVRNALDRFQAKGKKVIAYDVNWSEREYYLSSIADEVIINPMGVMEINGLSSQQIFFQGALEKYGIGVQVIRVGSYKSAVEPYTRKNLSSENRQQTQALLTDLWSKFLSTVGESRQLSAQDLQKIADEKGFVRPQYALKAGLVDRVAYFDKAIASLKELTGQKAGEENESVRQIALNTYASNTITEDSSLEKVDRKIAVVYAEGSIVGGKGNIQEIGSDRFAKEFRQLREDDSVKAVVLRVNSPGGSATASEVILREILLTRKHKPVIVSMGNIAASGGYWISAGADRIFAEENTITGSIGVFGLLTNIQEIGENHGVTWDVVKTGRFADIGSTVRPKTAEELAIYQKSVTNTYNLFLNKVAQYRNLPRKKVDEIAQGRIWSGKEAYKIGLVDQIGGLEAAIAYAAETAKLGKNWQLEEYPQQRSFEAEILDRLMKIEALEQTASVDPLTVELLKFKSNLTIFQSLNDPQGVYARLPFSLDID